MGRRTSGQVLVLVVLAGCSGARNGPTARAAPSSVTVATWNLSWLNRHSGKGPVKRSDEDYARLRTHVASIDADVVAFQEVDGPEAAARVFDPARYQVVVANDGGPQRVGFAVRAHFAVQRYPDVVGLDTGGVRTGVDIAVRVGDQTLRLLAVHLKSGCFSEDMTDPGAACQKLARQLGPLEEWIDARAAEGVPFVVLGDFNRRITPQDGFWTELSDGDPPNAVLSDSLPGRSTCWGAGHGAFIDHIVLDRLATGWLVPGSPVEVAYEPADTVHRAVLSDHCPIRVTLRPGAGLSISQQAAASPLRVKGNVSRGRRIYHLPTCPSYDGVVVDEARGERWFATEAEAAAAGWTRAANCP